MRKLITISIACVAVAAMMISCKNTAKKTNETAEAEAAAEQAKQDSVKAVLQANKEKEAMDLLAKLPEEPIFDIVTNLGTIKVKLYSKTRLHRENFAKLALTGYYDSLLFHRVIKGFMIQGGDPLTRDTSAVAVSQYGTGGPNYTVPAEFVPEYLHIKGALAAARRGDIANPKKASSGSQFYIVQDPVACKQLDGEYTVFGQTIEGMDVIDAIANVETNPRDLPINEVRIITIKLDKESLPSDKTAEGAE